MNANILRVALGAALASVALAGCQREAGAPTVGQKLDSAIDHTQELGGRAEAALTVAADKVIEKTGQAVTAVSDASLSPAVNDTAITASIKTDFLKDPDLSVLKIDVDTKGGVVTLNGLAGNEAARTRAEKMAGSIKGVKEVRNFLVVKRA